MSKIVLLTALAFLTFGTFASADKDDWVEVKETSDVVSLINKSQCFDAIGKSTKLSEWLFGYVAIGFKVKKIILSNERAGGPNGALILHDIGLSIANDSSSFNQTFKGCTAD